MIIARIDNEITARTPRRRGRSFKGALKYLLEGHRDAPKPERVLYAETVNILSDLDDAAHEMAATWDARFRLMAASGIERRNGSDNTAPVYHAVLSWRSDEDPPAPQEMAELAKQLLHLLGLGEHEAVLVAHGDTANPHLHIIANTVHTITGLTAPLRFDKRVMQGFAARYEELRGNIVCKGRFAPDARSAFNEAAAQGYSRRRDNRPRWARAAEAVKDAKRAALPSVVLELLTRHHSTFTPAQLARAVTTHTATASEFSRLMREIMNSPVLARLSDESGATRFTTRSLQRIETSLAGYAATLAGSISHAVSTAAIAHALSKFPGPEQQEVRDAVALLLGEGGLSMVVGYAGAGKSTLLRTTADAWRASGYRLTGLALAGRTAEALEGDTDIPSGTVAAFVMGLEDRHTRLTAKDILVVDEAGMLASHQLERVMRAASAAGAKVVLVGDPEQLQAIEAGGPFRYLVEHYDHARLSTVWRQKTDWMRAATRDLAEGRTRSALAAYEAQGMLVEHGTKADAVEVLLSMWLAGRERSLRQLILTATNADAKIVNEAARRQLHALGVLGAEATIDTANGPLPLARGDRIVFGRNDKTMRVKNGTIGSVTDIAGGLVSITIDGPTPRVVLVDPARYPYLAHGYAVTIHKAQGATVDRAYVLAASNMDRHSAYVALSRHRDRVSLHWSRDVFASRSSLDRALSRERLKDVTLDYEEALSRTTEDESVRVKVRSRIDAETATWARLYEAQRAEADHVASMSMLRWSFWYAANLARFVQRGALSLAQLHERERADLAHRLRAAHAVVSSTGPAARAEETTRDSSRLLGITKRDRPNPLAPNGP